MNRRDWLRLSAGWLGAQTLAGCVFTPHETASLTGADFSALRRRVRTPLGEVAFVERGQGPAALFLHGFPLNGFQWRDALARLSPYRRCIAPDLLGTGWSDAAPTAPVQ